MNIGEMQRKLSLWAEQVKERKFYDLFNLICNRDWLWLAYKRVAQNAGSKTAGCDGIDVYGFMQDEMAHIDRLHVTLKSGKFEPCPVWRVYIPKANGKMRPLGIPMALAYCTSLQATWGNDLGRLTPLARNEERQLCASSRLLFPTDSRCQDTAFSSLRRAVFPTVAENSPSDSEQ